MRRTKKKCKRCEQDKLIHARGLCKTCDMIVNPLKYILERKRVARAVSKIKTKKQSVRDLKKKLDEVFSLYIRLSYADSNGLVKCYTCNTIKPYNGGLYKGIHCGHFWSRKELSTRFNEDNCRPQCYNCNTRNPSQALPVFAQKLRNELGSEKFDLLEIKAKSTCKMGKFEYEYLIKEYEKKVKELLANLD